MPPLYRRNLATSLLSFQYFIYLETPPVMMSARLHRFAGRGVFQNN